MVYIVFISAAVYVISMMDQTKTFLSLLGFDAGFIMRGQVWRLVTWIFLPSSNNIFFILLTLYFYFFVGSTLEREWGTPKFTIYYISGMILNIVMGFVMRYGFGLLTYLTPSFLNLSMFFAFAVLFPDHVVSLFFIIPIKVKWLALANLAYFAYSIVNVILLGYMILALLPLVALLNFIIICGDDLLSYLRPYKARSSPQTINYRKAAKKAQRTREDTPYRHKCAVCGRTDIDSPQLEFRYCSRCEGYHCFCIEHINNHIHFQ